MAPATDRAAEAGRWPVWKLALLLYPFAAAAVAINLFLLGLLGQAVGLSALSPLVALLAAGPLGVPAAIAAGCWAGRLIDRAEGR